MAFALMAGSYLLAIGACAAASCKQTWLASGRVLVAVFPALHLSYGIGYLRGVVEFLSCAEAAAAAPRHSHHALNRTIAWLKRRIDMAVAAVGLLLLSPLCWSWLPCSCVSRRPGRSFSARSGSAARFSRFAFTNSARWYRTPPKKAVW